MTAWNLPPDPRAYRGDLPGRLWCRWELGKITRDAFWAELERVWGVERVEQLLRHEPIRLTAGEAYFDGGEVA